jgi:hypothetical protein
MVRMRMLRLNMLLPERLMTKAVVSSCSIGREVDEAKEDTEEAGFECVVLQEVCVAMRQL